MLSFCPFPGQVYNVSVRVVFPFLSPAGVKKHLPDFLRDVRPGAASLFLLCFDEWAAFAA